MSVVLAVRNHLAIVFTDNEVLIKSSCSVSWSNNASQPVISGGWQGLVAYINLGSYYAFGLPLGYLLGYVAKLGTKVLWLGMIAGAALQTLLLLIILYKTNWNKEVNDTTERMRKWGGQDFETQKSTDGQLTIENGGVA